MLEIWLEKSVDSKEFDSVASVNLAYIVYIANVTSDAFESKDDPTQMTKIVIYNYILYYIQKTIHSKLICTNVHS